MRFTDLKRPLAIATLSILLAKVIAWLGRDLLSSARNARESILRSQSGPLSVREELDDVALKDEQYIREFIGAMATDRNHAISLLHMRNKECWLCQQLDTPFIEQEQQQYAHNLVVVDDAYEHIIRLMS